MNLSSIKTFALDVLFPKTCLSCGSEGYFLCDPCRIALLGKIEMQKCPVCSYRNASGIVCDSCRKFTPLSRLLFALDYRDALARDLVHTLKYHGVRELASPLGELMATVLEKYQVPFPKTTLIVPVPLHTAKMRKRGFNQAMLIAEMLAEKTGFSLTDGNLVRKMNTQTQIELSDFKERRKNMQGAFALKQPEAFVGKRILLVDDVSTSLSTLNEAARILREVGALTVAGIVVARG